MSESPSLHPQESLTLERAPDWVKGRPWLQRLLVAVTSVSVSTKIMGIVMALTILLGLAVTLQVRSVMAKALLGELHNQGTSLAADLANRVEPFMLANDMSGLEALLADTLRHYPDARFATVVDTNGETVAQVFQSGAAAANGESDGEEQTQEFTASIGDELGVLHLGMAEARIWEIVADVTEQMLLTTLLVAGVGILAAMLLTWLLTRPILDLVTTTQRLRQGDLSVRAPHWNDDEIGALSDAFNQMVSELEASQQAVIAKENARTHLLSRLISAQEEERKRIARELHDGVGQALTSILVHIKVLAQDQDPATRTRMGELRQLVDETLADVRMLSRELRPSALDDLGLAAALERYVAEFAVRYPTLEVDLHCNLPRRLPANLETSLYRIIQEAMTNTARHSHATSLSVVVNQRERAVHAIIEDNGGGFDVESTRRAGTSVGLHSMSERSELLNGSLEIESSDEGTTIYVQIPLVDEDTTTLSEAPSTALGLREVDSH